MAWYKEININSNIDNVWVLFNEENFKKIMPQVISHKLVSEDLETNTRVYEEVYREGKREETYLLTEVIEKETNEVKHMTFSFTIANIIYSEGSFLLEKIDENNTRFTYSGDNQGKNFFIKIILKLSSKKSNDKVVNDFLALVKKRAEA